MSMNIPLCIVVRGKIVCFAYKRLVITWFPVFEWIMIMSWEADL